MSNLNMKTGVGYKKQGHKGDCNETSRQRSASKVSGYSEQGRDNYDTIFRKPKPSSGGIGRCPECGCPTSRGWAPNCGCFV